MTARTRTGRSQSPETTVQLLVDHEGNRRVLTRVLAPEYTVCDAKPDDIADAAFDVCILDAQGFATHRDELAAKKQTADPAFLPYLIVADGKGVEHLPDTVWNEVDEVLTTPVAPAELRHRLDNLLERRRLSLDLKRRKERSEERFETLFDTAPDPIVVTSADGIIAEVNDAFARTVGAERADLVGESITDLGFEPTDTVERVLLRVVDTERDGDGETAPSAVTIEVDDESLVTELNADVVTALSESSERIGIFRDVTEREKRELKLRQQNERLEEFAATIAHDLRNPLSIAQGHLKLTRETGADSLDTVARALDRMEELIDEILTLARQGQLVRNPEPVSFDDSVTRAWQNVETEAATLSVEGTADILADEGRLCECLENLFRNSVEHGSTSNRPQAGDSVEHGSAGNPTVAVRVGTLDGDESGFFVADDGPGIPESNREDVFEAGYTDADRGTGFGLSIVQQIADGHDWDVSIVESRDGGARFEITNVDII